MPTKQDQIRKTLTKFYQNPIAKVSLEAFLSVLAIIVFAVFAIRPTLLTVSDLIKEIEDKEKIEEQMQRKVAALSSAQDAYLFNKDKFQYLDQAIPPEPQLLYSLKIVEKLASDNSLVIEKINAPEIPEETSAPTSAENLERKDLVVQVTVIGSYQNMRQFVEDLHQSRRTFVVHSVAFNIREDRGLKLLTANLAITVPYFD